MKRVYLALLATLVLALSLALPAHAANGGLTYLQSPFSSSASWTYTTWPGNPAHDCFGPVAYCADVADPGQSQSPVYFRGYGFDDSFTPLSVHFRVDDIQWSSYCADWRVFATIYTNWIWTMQVTYVHLTNVQVSKDSYYAAGTHIGYESLGNGNCATGWHQHLEISSNGRWLNTEGGWQGADEPVAYANN
jgi:hypothetical protein